MIIIFWAFSFGGFLLLWTLQELETAITGCKEKFQLDLATSSFDQEGFFSSRSCVRLLDGTSLL